MPRHQILLIRQSEGQLTGSGCCGKVGGRHSYLRDTETFADTRRDMEAMGRVYQALRHAFGERVEITMADPRNLIWLLPSLLRAGYRSGGTQGAWQAVRGGFAPCAVLVDGQVVASGEVPEPEAVVAAVRRLLALADRPGAQGGPGLVSSTVSEAGVPHQPQAKGSRLLASERGREGAKRGLT